MRQTADFSAAVAVLEPSRFAGLAFIGSFRCSVASPWQLWHMLPLASFAAPCPVSRIVLFCFSWQVTQIGTLSAADLACANAGSAVNAAKAANSPVAAMMDLSRM